MSDAPTCRCGRGKMSAHDGKCGHCRTKKEKKALDDRFKPPRFFGDQAHLNDALDALPDCSGDD